jgi:hypothetical protein
MNVQQLIDALQKVPNKNVPVLFSYDSRVCAPEANIVDFTPSADQDGRVFASDFTDEPGEEPEDQGAVVLRSESQSSYEYHCPSQSREEYVKEQTDYYTNIKENWYKENACLFEDGPRSMWTVAGTRDFTIDEYWLQSVWVQSPGYAEKSLQDSIKSFDRHKEETAGVINLHKDWE